MNTTQKNKIKLQFTDKDKSISSSTCLIHLPPKSSFSEPENNKLSDNTTETIAPPPTQKRVNNIRPKHAVYAGLDDESMSFLFIRRFWQAPFQSSPKKSGTLT